MQSVCLCIKMSNGNLWETAFKAQNRTNENEFLERFDSISIWVKWNTDVAVMICHRQERVNKHTEISLLAAMCTKSAGTFSKHSVLGHTVSLIECYFDRFIRTQKIFSLKIKQTEGNLDGKTWGQINTKFT